jgi:hypothetical protein
MTKIRNGFVPNSSSSSFIINLDDVSTYQCWLIENHIDHAAKYFPDLHSRPTDAWNIIMKADTIEGETFMDNFDMKKFMENIGVNLESVKWDY